MQSDNIKKNKHIFGFVFFVLLCVITDRVFLNGATINDQFIFGIVGSNFIAILAPVLTLLLIFFLIIKNNQKYYFAFSLISAGVASNIIDRTLYGGVIDYLKLFFIPTFNLADVLIIIGMAYLAGLLIQNKKSPII